MARLVPDECEGMPLSLFSNLRKGRAISVPHVLKRVPGVWSRSNLPSEHHSNHACEGWRLSHGRNPFQDKGEAGYDSRKHVTSQATRGAKTFWYMGRTLKTTGQTRRKRAKHKGPSARWLGGQPNGADIKGQQKRTSGLNPAQTQKNQTRTPRTNNDTNERTIFA